MKFVAFLLGLALPLATPLWASDLNHEQIMDDMIATLRADAPPVVGGPVPDAFVAMEDRQPFGVTLMRSGLARGLARGFIPTRDNARSLELAYTARITADLSQAQILNSYMARVYLGRDCYGVMAASQAFFDKPVAALNLREAAMLAAAVKAPSYYLDKQNLWAKRASFVLGQMELAGLITAEDAKFAVLSPDAALNLPGKCIN